MTAFEIHDTKNGFSMKLWRGERMCLVGFDVANPEPDLVGFSIECRAPGETDFFPLMNRIAFSYDSPVDVAVTGARKFPSTESPFQKFRWVHFPHDPKPGKYTYRAAKIHMPADGKMKKGTQIQLDLSLDPITYEGFLDVGFTRGFASSQAFADRFADEPDIDVVGRKIIPAKAEDGLGFQKFPGDIYEWLGFEAYDLVIGFLDEAVADSTIRVDAFAYDFNEPDILARMEKLGGRLRAILDDSGTHAAAGSAESKAAKRLRASAGKDHVRRTHFTHLQHHKVLIASRNGKPFKVLAGSTNFSFRGIYIQSNNVLVFDQPDVADLYGRVFQAAFDDPLAFKDNELARKWHLVHPEGRPPMQFCFSPHDSADLSLNPVRGAIDQADSSVLFSIAFLYQIQSGPTREAIDRLMTRPVFSYGVSDKKGDLEVRKPDGSIGLVDFAYLAEHSPQPFRREWSGGKGINVHHKFVVTDFSLPTAKVFTGSSNLSPAGEKGNGDHLVMIQDPRVATGYAIEALRIFDHLHFRSRMRDAQKAKKAGKTPKEPLALRKPKAITGKPAWFEAYYVAGSQRERDRKLFSS